MADTDPVTKAEFRDEMSRLRETLDRWKVPIQAEHDKMKKTMYGNGEPGMDENLRNITKWVEEQKEKEKNAAKDKKDTTLYLWRGTVATALAAFVMLLINGFLYFFKLLPIIEKLAKP